MVHSCRAELVVGLMGPSRRKNDNKGSRSEPREHIQPPQGPHKFLLSLYTIASSMISRFEHGVYVVAISPARIQIKLKTDDMENMTLSNHTSQASSLSQHPGHSY